LLPNHRLSDSECGAGFWDKKLPRRIIVISANFSRHLLNQFFAFLFSHPAPPLFVNVNTAAHISAVRIAIIQ
jgi:hypothetical protein